MKKLVFLFVLAVTLIAVQANAGDNVNVGDLLKFTDSYGSTNGGEFIVTNSTTGSEWISFCLERDEYISFGLSYKVNDISSFAIAGGVNTDSNDQLDYRTAYLYTKFRAGTLSNYDYGTGELRVNSANSLQNAIWYIEQEISTGLDTQANNWVQEATEAGWTNWGNVQVINIVDSNNKNCQSQLALVPEPSILALLGLGLCAVPVLTRRLKVKA